MLNGASTLSTATTPAPATRSRVRRILPALLAFCAVLVVVRPIMAAAASDTHTLVCFGDSLTAGYGLDDPTAEAYPALVQRKLDAENRPWRVVNAGVSGDTTAGGLRRVDWVLRQPVDIFVLALGANDGLRGIDPALTQQNLVQIIERVRARYPAAKVVIAGMLMPPGMGEDYTRRYAAVFPEVARRERATLLPFLLEGVAGRPDLNQSDSIHPTAAGQRIIADNVWKTLRPLL